MTFFYDGLFFYQWLPIIMFAEARIVDNHSILYIYRFCIDEKFKVFFRLLYKASHSSRDIDPMFIINMFLLIYSFFSQWEDLGCSVDSVRIGNFTQTIKLLCMMSKFLHDVFFDTEKLMANSENSSWRLDWNPRPSA